MQERKGSMILLSFLAANKAVERCSFHLPQPIACGQGQCSQHDTLSNKYALITKYRRMEMLPDLSLVACQVSCQLDPA